MQDFNRLCLNNVRRLNTMKTITKILAFVLFSIIIVCFCVGCTKPSKPQIVEPNYKEPNLSQPQDDVLLNEAYQNSIAEFSFNLFKTLSTDENACISPLSVYLAFACLTNASNGETLNQIASAMELTPEEINEYCSYLMHLYQGDESNAEVVKIANSVWFKESFAPKQSFVDDAFSIYDADIIKTNFDNETVKQTNAWISEKTNGLIKKMVERYGANTIMQIINAIVFEDDWSRPLNETTKKFTNSDNSQKYVEGGYRSISRYYESESAEAFKIGFKNSRFSFVGIRPKGDIDEYLSAFDASEYNNLMNNPNNDYDKVNIFIPFFNLDYEKSLVKNLKSLGIVDAFNPILSDFSRGWDNSELIYVSEVKHKTHFELSKDGVKAAAVTIIGMDATSAGPGYERKERDLFLDKPFIYMIVDNEYNVPLFIGNIKTL